jgi:hypothetical protein
LSTSAKRGRLRERSKLVIGVVLIIAIIAIISIIIDVIFLDVVLILRRGRALATTVRRSLICKCRTSLIIKVAWGHREAHMVGEKKTQYQPATPCDRDALACHAPFEH